MITSHRLGLVEYPDGLELQRQLQESRREEKSTDTLLLLHHPPTLTLGRGATRANIVASDAALDAHGVRVFETDRGGDVTYHGPRQIVGYPLLYLPPGRQDVRKYVRSIEEVVIRTLKDFAINATRIEKWPGVWVENARHGGPRKICAIGVHLSRWYTKHGFALNVEPNLSHFELIVPCGIKEAGVTSMAVELGAAPDIDAVHDALERHMAAVFEQPIQAAPAPEKTVSVVVRYGGQVLLLRRAEDRGGFWQPVTGHVESHESPVAAATRELFEETGIAAAPRSLDYVHSFARGDARPPRVTTEHAFVVDVSGSEVRLSAEHVEFKWVSVQEATECVPHEGLKQALLRCQ